jgi:hypothetical protein
MDFDNYDRWLKIKLISNFLPKFDISSRQCSLPKCTTRSNSNFFIPKKNAMIDWLSDCGIPFSEQMCKPELYSLTNLHNQWLKIFNIYALLVEHSHSFLCLPLYHADLNHTELTWASVNYVTRKKVSFHLDDAMKLVEVKINTITEEECSLRCNNSRQCEQNYLQLGTIPYDISEQKVKK